MSEFLARKTILQEMLGLSNQNKIMPDGNSDLQNMRSFKYVNMWVNTKDAPACKVSLKDIWLFKAKNVNDICGAYKHEGAKHMITTMDRREEAEISCSKILKYVMCIISNDNCGRLK